MTKREKYVSDCKTARQMVRDMGLNGISFRAAMDNRSGLFPVQVVSKLSGKTEKELLSIHEKSAFPVWHHAKVDGKVIKVNYVHINC